MTRIRVLAPSDRPARRAAVAAAPAPARPALSIVGLGYVGVVSLACLAHRGFRLIGVDVDTERVQAVSEGRAPIVERRLAELLAAGVEERRIQATADLARAILSTDVSFVCVGTPSRPDGSCDLSAVIAAARAIGEALAMKTGYHVVVLRSSVPPGTTLGVIAPEIERTSGLRTGRDFGLCFNPEFMREGTAVEDFHAPPKTVIGACDARAARTVASVYAALQEPTFTTVAAAEMLKYADNVWHATKVAFANEIGRLCKAAGVDSHEVMDVFVTDTKLNISPYYLKPGFAFGGSCLPKEVRAVSHLARKLGVEVPLCDSLLASNECQIELAADLLAPFRGRRIGFLGLTFKAGTDDLRESPMLALMGRLMSEGETIAAYDPNMLTAASPVAEHLPLLPSAAALVAQSDVVVVGHATEEFRAAIAARPPQVHVLDLVRLFRTPPRTPTYHGIAW